VSSTLSTTAPAKVNLALLVEPRRQDGYHPLTTVFMALSLEDKLSFQQLTNGRIEVAIRGEGASYIPHDGTDLSGQAAALLRQRFGSSELGVKIDITKSIPVAAGLAGGSADAAATLGTCNQLWGLNASQDDLLRLATELGADVPFGLIGGVALGQGRGDLLTPLPTKGDYHWALAFANRGLSTAKVFAAFDNLPAPPDRQEVIDQLVQALAVGDTIGLGQSLTNDLQEAVLKLQPELNQTLTAGAKLPDVLGAIISGSGPTCAFLCQSTTAAEEAANFLANLPQVRATKAVSGPLSK